MFWLLMSPVWSAIGAIIGFIIGSFIIIAVIFFCLLPYIFKAVAWAARIVMEILDYAMIYGRIGLRWGIERIRKNFL